MSLIHRLAGPTLILIVLLRPEPLAAQSADDRQGLERVRAELATIDDSVALKARESSGIARARVDRDNTMLHLQLGFIAYRLGEVTGDNQHFDDAGSEFEWASELQPEWPYPWYGLGLAELAMGEQKGIALENIKEALGRDYLTKAAAGFAHATNVDPGFAPAVVDLVRTTLRQHVNPHMEVLLTTPRAAATTAAAANPAVQLVRGRIEMEVGEGDSALAAFQRYVAVGGDSGVGFFEQGRSLYFLGRAAEGEGIYFAGARVARSAESRALYRQDVAWVADSDELAAFDSIVRGDASVAGWLQQFWTRRDANDALEHGAALATHERRYFYAWRHFRLVSPHRHYDMTETFRSDQTVFDDRGIVYLRQGPPDKRAVYPSAGVEPNESWMYRRQAGNLIFHFVARDDVDDYKLVQSIGDVLGFDAALQLQSTPGAESAAAALFESRGDLDPIYRRLGAGGEGGMSALLADERRRGQVAIHVGTTTEDYAPRFAQPIDPHLEVYALGAGPSSTTAQLLVVFAVPARALSSARVGEQFAYPVTARVTGLTSTGATLFADTTRVFATTHPMSGGDNLSWVLAAPAGAGQYRLRVLVTQPGSNNGSLVRLDSVRVPPFGSGAFALSDLVTGRRDSGLSWLDGVDTVALNPLQAYPQGSTVELYYELHGLARGAPYHARIEVEQEGGRSLFKRIAGLFGGGGAAVSADYDGVAEGAVSRVHQEVSLARVSPGRYRVRLTVTLPGSDTRHQRDATLVVQGK